MAYRPIQKANGFVVIDNNPLEPGYPSPNVNAVYGPYESLAQAYDYCLQIFELPQNIPQSTTVGVKVGNEVEEYWFKAKKPYGGYSLGDLEKKLISTGSSSFLTNDEKLALAWVRENMGKISERIKEAEEKFNNLDTRAENALNDVNIATENINKIRLSTFPTIAISKEYYAELQADASKWDAFIAQYDGYMLYVIQSDEKGPIVPDVPSVEWTFGGTFPIRFSGYSGWKFGDSFPLQFENSGTWIFGSSFPIKFNQ